jgi:hypothetical protein
VRRGVGSSSSGEGGRGRASSCARASLAAALGLLFVALGLSACGDECVDGARTYRKGDTWTCSDGCNTCSCAGADQVETTAKACSGEPGPAAGKLFCDDGDTLHQHGSSWKCGSGEAACAMCTCNDGQPEDACTK